MNNRRTTEEIIQELKDLMGEDGYKEFCKLIQDDTMKYIETMLKIREKRSGFTGTEINGEEDDND